ncbi:hypothetical protein ABOM_000705 [Aspergillus bombycis]|uniref:NADP-dependent oxidoreductase domain-containing protein n=1 Tax=Aspergillus bombycis TaxID=109264 RepID=A0A1F8AH43_9EURO|nr:hypothetical protein ABOM_000705 [Aspergillus bombycis]OGM50739.1 hypothetical protein ABOM_000705 [Aspergillus bombycis]
MIENEQIGGRAVPVEDGHVKAAPNMQYVRLGNSGLKVSRLILGTATYGPKTDVAWRVEEGGSTEASQRSSTYTLDKHSCQTFLAQLASLATGEEIIGKFLKIVLRENAVVMTKSFFPVGDSPKAGPAGLTVSSGNNRKHIFENVKAGLKRLQTDYIDVLLNVKKLKDVLGAFLGAEARAKEAIEELAKYVALL